ncbi:MAG TPA: hypothetical protein VJ373_02335 [Desulfatiglandales bacterium]|nr:hypothetical protein [Desulfatiglandales bacterium]
MHASETAETAGAGPEPAKVGYQYAPVIPHYNIGDIAASCQDQCYLSLDLKGDGSYLAQ